MPSHVCFYKVLYHLLHRSFLSFCHMQKLHGRPGVHRDHKSHSARAAVSALGSTGPSPAQLHRPSTVPWCHARGHHQLLQVNLIFLNSSFLKYSNSKCGFSIDCTVYLLISMSTNLRKCDSRGLAITHTWILLNQAHVYPLLIGIILLDRKKTLRLSVLLNDATLQTWWQT